MEKGDKLYRVIDGNFIEVTFIEESLAHPSCKETTYIVRYPNGTTGRVGKTIYNPNKRECLLKYIRECYSSLTNLHSEMQSLIDQMECVHEYLQSAIKKIEHD